MGMAELCEYILTPPSSPHFPHVSLSIQLNAAASFFLLLLFIVIVVIFFFLWLEPVVVGTHLCESKSSEMELYKCNVFIIRTNVRR